MQARKTRYRVVSIRQPTTGYASALTKGNVYLSRLWLYGDMENRGQTQTVYRKLARPFRAVGEESMNKEDLAGIIVKIELVVWVIMFVYCTVYVW